MKKNSSIRFFRIAIAGSLFLHFAIALFVHSRPVVAAPEPKPGRTYIITLPAPTPTPQPPKPQVSQPPQRTNTLRHRPPMVLVHQRSHTGGPAPALASAMPGTPDPRDFETPAPQSSAAPGTPAPPSPTPKPACSAPDVEARAIDTVTPETPPDAQGVNAQAKVKVDLDASGAVTGASVYASTGNQILDMAAVRAAKATRYAPEERRCTNVPGSYLFTVDFQE